MSGKYTAQLFIDAIPGTGGIISTIAKRIGCEWHTVKNAIERWPSVKAVYDSELEKDLDTAESVLLQNILLAYEEQIKEHKIVDAADAKWYLTRKGKKRGYAERQELTGAEGEKLESTLIILPPKDDK